MIEQTEIYEKLKQAFPVLERVSKNFRLKVTQNNELELVSPISDCEIENSLTQQDCLELSQLFALLATVFQEVEENE